MCKVLSTATLPSEIESPSGDRYTVTEAILNEALHSIYANEQSALMHLREVRTFSAIDLTTRHPN
eukprot:11610635-Prorocentrum_lima.AAC.1